MEDFSLPTQVIDTSPVDIQDMPSLEKKPETYSDDIVYSSLLSSGNPKEAYLSAKEEVARTGTSSLVEQQTKQWQKEQVSLQQSDMESILSDPTVPIETRRNVAKQYVEGGFVLQDLRDKYLIKQSTVDPAITEADREAQDVYSETVLTRDKVKKDKEEQRLIEEAGSSFTDAIKAAGSLAANIAISIPAGLAAGFVLLKEQDPTQADEVLKYIQAWAYNPTEVGAQKVLDKLGKAIEFIDIPFKWLGDKTLDITGSPLAATAVYSTGEMVGYIGGAQLTRVGIKAAIRKGKPTVPPLSPLDTAETASKQAASELAAAAVKDEANVIPDALRTTKEAIINDYYLPGLKEEFGDIKGDTRELLDHDKAFTDLYDETELDAKISPVTQIKAERELYLKVLTETTKPHLLLSSSVIGSVDKAFGRNGKGVEALVDTDYTKLEGTAVYGRNPYHGYKTEKGAQAYLEKLKEQTKHLPEQGDFSLLEKDKEFFINWNFKRNYSKFEELAFGAESINAHFLRKNWDITWLANTPVGDKIWPAYMRMDPKIPAGGATAALKEARIEGAFINAQRALFMGTKHPKELVNILIDGEEQGKVFNFNEIQTNNQHLKVAEVEQLHKEYVGFRRVQDHLYRFADREYRKQLQHDSIKHLYDKDGKHIGLVSEPIKDLEGISAVWDIASSKLVDKKDIPQISRVVRLKESVRIGDDKLEYALLSPFHQLGEIRAGALTKIPGYVARHYKEWFVLDKAPTTMRVNGYAVPKGELRNHSQAVAMGGTRSEINQLLENFQKEDPNNTYTVRAEEKRIEDSIINDSHIYSTYLKEHHKRSEKLPGLNRDANVEDVLVAQTRTIQGVAKMTAWGDYTEVMQKNWVKAFGEFTQGKFPGEINEIVPLRKMDAALERKFLAAQKIYQQWEMQQLSQMPSDVLWKSTLNNLADVFEKTDMDASVLRELGEKGIIPVRAAKALGSNLFLFGRPLRMWAVQPQQFKELAIVNPSFGKSLLDVVPIVTGLLGKSQLLHPLKSIIDKNAKTFVKDYSEIIKALEETGILQAVNMNQMIHGIWRDSLKELDPKAMGKVGKTLDTTGKVISAPFRIGRKIGYDPAELTNQVTLWLFSKHRWEENNPGKKWNTPEVKEEIMQYAQRIGHMASTRAGMYSWQEGTISVITQFAAIPFKSMMQMISAKEFSGKEKAALAAARLFWYGKYGMPYGANISAILERNLNDEEKKKLGYYSEGMTSIVWEQVLGGMFDASNDMKSDISASKSMSTVPDSIWFYDLGATLLKMAQGQPTDQKFPFISAGSSLFTAVQGTYDMFTLPPELGNERDWSDITWKAVGWVGFLSDYSKSQMAETITKSGSSLGYQQTGGEAVARLFGVIPTQEQLMWEFKKDESKRDKYIQEDAKQIHARLISFLKDKDLSHPEVVETYITGMKAFLARVEPGYREEIMTAILKEDKRSHSIMKESILKYMYVKAKQENDTKMNDLMNITAHMTDPDIQEMRKSILKARGEK